VPVQVRTTGNEQTYRETYQSPITNHQSPITNHQSPITNHQSPVPRHLVRTQTLPRQMADAVKMMSESDSQTQPRTGNTPVNHFWSVDSRAITEVVTRWCACIGKIICSHQNDPVDCKMRPSIDRSSPWDEENQRQNANQKKTEQAVRQPPCWNVESLAGDQGEPALWRD
jgi:hypothetical protein